MNRGERNILELRFNTAIANTYTSKTQRNRVLTESWVAQSAYCVSCGNPGLVQHKANSPIADFSCHGCGADFELKSKVSPSGEFGSRIVNGAYATMIQRIASSRNPHLMLLTHFEDAVNNLVVIPKHFLVPDIIQKRKPLNAQAKRAGWVGCNIAIGHVPASGRIRIISNGTVLPQHSALRHFEQFRFLQNGDLVRRGWILELLAVLDQLPADLFSLSDVYQFESVFAKKYPDNKFIRPKLRQQLQVLRDRGVIEFLGQGRYRKVVLQ